MSKDKTIAELCKTIDRLMGQENIRDRFAMQALPWCLEDWRRGSEDAKSKGIIGMDDLAIQAAVGRAYRIAEEMLEARIK